MEWAIAPWGCEKLLKWIDARYDKPEIIITENGCTFPDKLIDANGNSVVEDKSRLAFLKNYLKACHKAIESGVNLKGYFLWSFLDNFEWASGYSKQFGITYIEPKTLNRIPKSSAHWYSKVIEQNGFV